MVPLEAFAHLSVGDNPVSDDRTLLVISHDCDLADDDLEREPFVELVWAERVDVATADFTHAKSPGVLDLTFKFEERFQTLRLWASRKLSVRKIDLAPFTPDPRYDLDEKGRRALQSWLATRYRRAAIPDSLHEHLTSIRKTLQDVGNKSPHAIIGIFLHYDPDEELSASDGPYELWLTVVFDHEIGDAEAIAEKAAEKIARRIENKFKTEAGWQSIDLRSCKAVSDLRFSFYDSQTLKQFRLEHISLKHSAKVAE